MEYKKILEELVEKLTGDWSLVFGSEEGTYYANAVSGALEVIRYYEDRDMILNVREGKQFVDELDKAWYFLKTGQLAERLGLDEAED